MDLASVDELLSTTRSVRRRLDLTRPVGREVILECLQLATACSSCQHLRMHDRMVHVQGQQPLQDD